MLFECFLALFFCLRCHGTRLGAGPLLFPLPSFIAPNPTQSQSLPPAADAPSTVPRPYCLRPLPRQPPGTRQMRAAPATHGRRPPAPVRIQQGRVAVTHMRLAGRLKARPARRLPAAGVQAEEERRLLRGTAPARLAGWMAAWLALHSAAVLGAHRPPRMRLYSWSRPPHRPLDPPCAAAGSIQSCQ